MEPRISALNGPTATLGECPVWSTVESALYWVDIEPQLMHRHDPALDTTETRRVEGRPGSIVLTDQPGMLIVAVEHQLVRFDWAAGTSSVLVDLEAPGTGNRLNDGRCDPAGRYVVGSMFADTAAGKTSGVLYQVSPAGMAGNGNSAGIAVATIRSSIAVTNGLAFDAERERLYFADTPTEQVVVYDYDSRSGAVSNERAFFDYSDHAGKPDGACVDAEGCYWSASVYGWGLLRITPDGTVDRKLDLPLHKPSMPCFGGPDLDILYITTIGSGGTTPSEPGRDGFEPGQVLVVEGLGIRGVAEPLWPFE